MSNDNNINREIVKATNVNSLNNFPNEIILCIFEYLTPIERYNSFFHFNSRFRKLVKRKTDYSRKELTADIRRFSTLHSWYKHLSFRQGGARFYIVPTRGQQRRNLFSTRITDSEQLHWHFYHDVSYLNDKRVIMIIHRYPIYLNPFFYHSECRSNKTRWRIFSGGLTIIENNQDEIIQWLRDNYPEYVENILRACQTWKGIEKALIPVFDNEWTNVLKSIHSAADHIWKELKELTDVNIFDISMSA